MPLWLYQTVLSAFFFLVGCGESPDNRGSSCKGVPNKSKQETTETSASNELVTYTEEREPCGNRNPMRNAYFGDLTPMKEIWSHADTLKVLTN